MKRTATAHWTGDLKTGQGQISTQSQSLSEVPYSFPTRFEDQQGTNPEELVAAAHAACFTMATSAFLEKSGFVAQNLKTKATLELENRNEAWSITRIHLELVGRVDGITQQMFEQISANAKENCPISRLLKATISLDAKLEN